jgi:hypothetical protein
MKYNNRIHSDHKKRRSFVALLFAAGDLGPLNICQSAVSRSSIRGQKIEKDNQFALIEQ